LRAIRSAVHVTLADEQERDQVDHLCTEVQQATDHARSVWYTGDKTREARFGPYGVVRPEATA
jgi:hypothetical protein